LFRYKEGVHSGHRRLRAAGLLFLFLNLLAQQGISYEYLALVQDQHLPHPCDTKYQTRTLGNREHAESTNAHIQCASINKVGDVLLDIDLLTD